MKIGMRKPSIKKRVKARTTGKLKRQVKKATIPMYGKKGTGIIKNPKKAVYNKVYNKTTFSVDDIISQGSTYSQNTNNSKTTSQEETFSERPGLLGTIINTVVLLFIAIMVISCVAFIIFLFID